MLESSLVKQFLAALPSGEYSSTNVLSAPEGLMAARFQTVLAEATWLRLGGRPCFIKAVRVAGTDASENTAAVAGADRLARVGGRIERARSIGVPIVEVFHSGFIGEREFFLLCMDRVTPLDKVELAREERIALAARLLRQLAPPADGGWHHFDVCLKNLGVDADGNPVFIDLDSLYLVEGEAVFVSTPIGKLWRLPRTIQSAVEEELQHGLQLTSITAQSKQRFDLALAAAELTLPRPVLGRPHAADDWIPAWLNSAPDAELVGLWRAPLLTALAHPDSLDLQDLAARLEALLGPESVSTSKPQHPEHAVESSHLLELGSRMRNDLLSRSELEDYRMKLRQHLAATPNDHMAWQELRLLTIGYLRDLDGAATAVTEALEHFPGDPGFARWRDVLHAWKQDVKGR